LSAAPIFISVGVAFLLHLLLRHTRIGLMFYGVGSNASVATFAAHRGDGS
jgi:ribose/xylose/arabinose/galactoside ABC-type transport system permease subunit